MLTGPWYELYNILEFIEARTSVAIGETKVNEILEREMSGYRMRGSLVVPISDPVELDAVDEALDEDMPFTGARIHLQKALEALGARPEPDLRNAIKEAISGVESAARLVSGKPRATLGDAIKALERAGRVHPALKKAWLSFYGYTSDEQGLRHAMIDEPQIDFSTAKYLVVSCAAFVNLLSAIPSSE